MENINKILSEIPESEKTATVVLLVEIIGVLQKEIQELKDEIARLKGNPPKPKLKPSTTSKIDKAVRKKTSRRKKRRAKKTVAVEIHNTVELHPENIPEGSEFLWYRDYTVQDIVIKANNTKYRRGVWKTPSGEIIRGKFPEPIKGHYGEKLKSYILYLYHELHVTQPLIFSHLNEIGVNISEGQINNILIENQDIFHNEKEELLEVGLRISPHIVSDDTGLRHKGKNGYCTHIGNELFAYFKSSDSKSRINFLEIMRGKNTDYYINGYAILYYEEQKLSNHKLMLLKRSKGKKFNTRSEWLTYLKQLGIRDEFHIKKATEGALIGSLFANGINPSLAVVSDDAGQFDILWHGLCWVHSERVITSINSASVEQDKAINEILDEFWEIFRELHAYKETPSDTKRKEINSSFDELFSRKTDFESVNAALKSLRAKKKELLLVLDRPEIPLTNNISENDTRDQAKKRKISAGTRSDEGRKCRDTFMSLKKTCKKLELSFATYLYDRITGQNKVPGLVELMRKKAVELYGLPPPNF